MAEPQGAPAPRVSARVLLLDQADRVLLLHVRDPAEPERHWWELPGGGVEPSETLAQAAIRELAEETGIVLPELMLGQRWWSHSEVLDCHDDLQPPALSALLGEILAGQLDSPVILYH
ncbi:MAG TPA: NUDIX domain-containing protein [Pseudonocardiaceae bacterium]|nr:NUDIX domain-containing protein [Pseudonocardiaceae bacterium]